ncbi:MAG: hypothetical protein WA862_03715 [Solirubrobacterales bacterium]
MKRIKNLSLAVVAALALTAAIGGTSASATGFVSDFSNGYTTINGSGIGTEHEIAINAGSFRCAGFGFQAATPQSATSLTTSPLADSACGSGTFKTNGCQFTFKPGEETAPGSFNGTIDIGPPGCGPMSFTIFACKATFGAQTGLNATYVNVGSGTTASVEVTLATSKLKYSQETSGGWFGCPNESNENGVYRGSWMVKATNPGGESTGLHVVAETGIYVAGESPKFEAEKYPVSFAGAQASANENKLTTTETKSSCTGASFAGELGAASTELGLAAQYSGCNSLGFPATVAMNGCEYVLHVLSGPAFAGTADISCPAGKEIVILVKVQGVTKCTTTIGAQGGLSGTTFTNLGTGNTRGVQVGFNLSGIKYHQQAGSGGGACKATGDFSDATYSGSATLYDVLH